MSLDRYKFGEFYKCGWCNRKYKRTSKLEEHITKVHPSARLHENHKTFSEKEREYILKSLEEYIEKIKDFDNCVSEKDSAKLLPTVVNPSQEELERIGEAHRTFARRVVNSSLVERVTSNHINLEKLLVEFNLFLNLGQPWRGGNFCPTLAIDLMWHAAMMKRKKYRKLCEQFLGEVLPHCLNENANDKGERYTEFINNFKSRFNRAPLSLEAFPKGKDESSFVTFREKQERLARQEEERKAREKAEQEERWRKANEAWARQQAEKRAQREAYFKQHGRYPPSPPRSRWDAQC